MSDIQKAALGLVGETIAYAWLQRHYPDVCSPASWVSSYRETIGEPPGNNSLGYDFKISLKQTTLYFEVKATNGTEMRFDLGESEVSKAAGCARTRRDDYRIIFITQASNASACKLYVLRNPMDPRYQRFYGFPGSGLICTFSLAD
jgi:Protein NO VEIN, C-terminal